MSFELHEVAYFMLPVALVVYFAWRQSRITSRSSQLLEQAKADGLMEPASLHPVIEEHRCIGCKSCVNACPEKDVLGVIHSKAKLINPSHCIGHGACKTACPVGAITLVFGTETRGIDIPQVNPDFETNIPGVYIAGELGGMGLIRNAVEQGRQAMENISKRKRGQCQYDVIIIGAGPAGFSASLLAQQKGMKYLTLEQDSLGGTVFNFPRGKIVMTQPMKLAQVGKIKMRETTKEALLELWQGIETKTGVQINYQENMQSIVPMGTEFTVTTDKGSYTANSVLLTIGRRGTPRKLGVSGEELPKVVYRLLDPQQYQGQNVLVVGGGDSALEAAVSIARQPGTSVSLSYRSESFSRAKEKNRQNIAAAQASGLINVLFKSNVKEISKDKVVIDQQGKLIELDNDGVIVSAGGILPTQMLKSVGIEVETKYGTE